MVFKRLNERGKVFIEYVPIEKVWKPMVGINYMAINCLWVSGKFKGKGYSTFLLNECINDAKKMNGIVVVTSDKVRPFLVDKKFYLKNNFQVVDSAPTYFELLVLKFNSHSENPKFTINAKIAECENSNGFTFIYSNQCPFMEEYVELLKNVAEELKINAKVIKLKSFEEARSSGSPFGALGIYHKGKFITHELMTKEKFRKLMQELK